jgi:hypothetical protein
MVNYIPIATTLFSIYFFVEILRHYKTKLQALYLLWWTIGVLTYGLGTLTESINVLLGWSVINTKLWYITGAFLGGFPLAQGTVYLFFSKKTANILAIIVGGIIIIASVLVFLSPVIIPANFENKLTGSVFGWQFVRLFAPFINMYSFIFLCGGAVYSAYKYYKLGKTHARFLGNVFISIGSLLPGIGGSYTVYGHVEILFITEFTGLILMYSGYKIMKRDRSVSLQPNQVLVNK